MALPKDVRDRVTRRIYADMAAIGWDELSSHQKSKQYDEWVNDPDVGGAIGRFKDDPRHWIKDGPVKEWPRARIGHGPYAHLLGDDGHDPAAERRALAERLVRACLPGWVAAPDSIVEKPMRMYVHPPEDSEADVRVLAWAKAEDFKHLLWAALQATESHDHREWILAVTETFERPVSADTKALHQRIGRRCGLEVKHIEL